MEVYLVMQLRLVLPTYRQDASLTVIQGNGVRVQLLDKIVPLKSPRFAPMLHGVDERVGEAGEVAGLGGIQMAGFQC